MIVAHRPKHPVQLTAFKLDPQGQPIEPVEWALPKPAPLAARPNFALGILCHPRFPLLYVWQDVEAPPAADPPIPAAQAAEFDHLFIYSLEEHPPRLLMATCRGENFHCGTNAGGFCLDPAAHRLYIPNQQLVGPLKTIIPALGWIDLAPDGLPAPPDVPGAPPAPKPAPLDPPSAAAARAGRLAAGIPDFKRHLEPSLMAAGDWPAPYSYAAVAPDYLFLATHSGTASWTLSDRLGRVSTFYVQPYIPYRYRIAAHPTAPALYVSIVTYDGRIIRLEHAEGSVTLVPQTITLDNQVANSAPLVLPRTNELAIGAVNRVCLIKLTPEGRFLPEATGAAVPNSPTVEALAWSEKHGKLFVAAEKMP